MPGNWPTTVLACPQQHHHRVKDHVHSFLTWTKWGPTLVYNPVNQTTQSLDSSDINQILSIKQHSHWTLLTSSKSCQSNNTVILSIKQHSHSTFPTSINVDCNPVSISYKSSKNGHCIFVTCSHASIGMHTFLIYILINLWALIFCYCGVYACIIWVCVCVCVFELKLFHIAMTLKYGQDYWKWYEQVKLKEYCHHA